jgi:hypothetical protein
VRRDNLTLCGVALVALAGVGATWFGAPVAVRTIVGLPLVAFLPGFALTRTIFGPRLAIAERLLLSLALTLTTDIVTGILLSVSPWGLHPRPWAVALAGLTLGLLVAASFRHPRANAARRRLPTGSLLGGVVLAMCAGVTAVVIIADRQPSSPPAWLRGYTLLWLLPAGGGDVRVGLESGELSPMTYEIELRSRGKVVARWATGDIPPSGKWMRRIHVVGPGRLDAYLFRPQDRTYYRHVFVHSLGAS